MNLYPYKNQIPSSTSDSKCMIHYVETPHHKPRSYLLNHPTGKTL